MLLISTVHGLFDEGSVAEIQAPIGYLHLVVKLFLASSAGYDPIDSDYSENFIEPKEVDHFKVAQAAVGQSMWVKRGIRSSRDYLFYLFKADGRLDIEEEESNQEIWRNLTYTPQSRESQEPMGSPSIGGIMTVAGVPGDNTGVGIGPGPPRHQMPLIPTDLLYLEWKLKLESAALD